MSIPNFFGAAQVGSNAAGISALADSIKAQQRGIQATQTGAAALKVSTEASIAGIMQGAKSSAYQAKLEAENRARAAEAKAKEDGFNVELLGQLAKAREVEADATATDFRKGNEAKIAGRVARVAGSNLSGNSRAAVDLAARTESEFGSKRITSAGNVVAVRMRNQAKLSEMSRRSNLDTAFFARTAGQQTADNFEIAARIAAMGAAAKGAAGQAELAASIYKIEAGISATRVAMANASLKTAKSAYDLGSSIIGGGKKVWDEWGMPKKDTSFDWGSQDVGDYSNYAPSSGSDFTGVGY